LRGNYVTFGEDVEYANIKKLLLSTNTVTSSN